MALQNIGASNSDDAFYRYKMPRMITKIEGRGNGIKTNIVNMVDIAKALARPPAYTTKYFGCELGAQSKFDEKTGTSLVNGAHDTSKLAGLLENFIKKYVQCYGCGNPETEVIITKSQMIQLKCAACGFVSDVDMRDKLTSFILKNPPEAKKSSKDKKAMRRAEKERLKEGEAADEEMKKLKKETKKKVSSKDAAVKTSSKKKPSGLDGDHASPPRNHVNEEQEDDDNDDDDVMWQTDTSMEAARQRIQEQLNAVTADMVMLSTDDTEKPKTKKGHGSPKAASPPSEEHSNEKDGLSSHERLVEELKNNLKKGITASQFLSGYAKAIGLKISVENPTLLPFVILLHVLPILDVSVYQYTHFLKYILFLVKSCSMVKCLVCITRILKHTKEHTIKIDIDIALEGRTHFILGSPDMNKILWNIDNIKVETILECCNEINYFGSLLPTKVIRRDLPRITALKEKESNDSERSIDGNGYNCWANPSF
nr:eukaryotic translation initiation factor 5-like [Ipomoea batatas]